MAERLEEQLGMPLLRLRAVRELTESQGLNILEAVYAAGFGSTSAYYKALHELVLLD